MWCHVLLFGFPAAGLLLFAVLPLPVALAVYLPLSALSVGVGWVSVRALGACPKIGAEALPGRVARVASLDERTALVRVDGELWEAIPRDGLAPGRRVEIVGVDGLRLLVRPLAAPEPVPRG